LSAKHPAVLAHHFEDLRQQHQAATLGMWIFLATEVLLFGGLFLGYTVYRLLFPAAFGFGSGMQNKLLGSVNTVVLIGSSLTMALAVRGAQVGDRRVLVGCLALTLVLGATFLGIKAVEYTADYEEGTMPGPLFTFRGSEEHPLPEGLGTAGRTAFLKQLEMYFLLYFLMTGLHAAHMVLGMSVICVLLVLSRRGRFGPGYYAPVELMGLYWHFVDIIWIFLFPLLYLVGSH
jgi:cytochrome c oxidase subunit 3